MPGGDRRTIVLGLGQYDTMTMQSSNQTSRSLWKSPQELDQYLLDLQKKYNRSTFLLSFLRLADTRCDDICEHIAEHLVTEDIVPANAKDLSSLLLIIHALQRSVVYSLFAGDNSIALQTTRDIYSTTYGRVEAMLPFSDLIDAVLKLLKKELLQLMDDIKESDDDASVSSDVRQAVHSIFESLPTRSSVFNFDDESLKAEGNIIKAYFWESGPFSSMSYLRGATEQSCFIIALFTVTGLSLFSFKYGIVFGLIGIILCLLLRVDVPIDVSQDSSK
jgi:hypothetical protein